MSKSTAYKLRVASTKTLTEHMKRITFGGDDLASFPADQESAYIKLLFSKPDLEETNSSSPDSGSEKRPMMRTYTVRHFDPQKQVLDVDFVIHGDNGPASRWAMNAVSGDELIIAGPGPKKLVNLDAEWFFLVGDMTALPAISVNIEALPKDAVGYMVIEILSEADKQVIDIPKGINVHWVINPHPDRENSLLVDKVKTLKFLKGKPSIWAACEFTSMRALRKYFKQDMQVHKKDIYVSSYWKMGLSEDEHKSVKSKDSE